MPEAARVAERRAAGLCIACGTEDALPGRVRGERCAQTAREAAAERRAEARRAGLCEACMRRKAKPGRGRRCDACADKYLARQLERDRERRAAAQAAR